MATLRGNFIFSTLPTGDSMRRLIPLFFLGLLLMGLVGVFKFSGALARTGEFDSIVLDFRDSPEVAAQAEAAAKKFGLALTPNSEFSTDDHVFVAEGDRATIERFRQSELSQFIEFVEPNYVYKAFFAGPNDPDFAKQWNLKNIHAEEAWKVSRGKGITVAVIDTGVTQVKDLSDTKFVPGYDFVNNREQADDDNGHGTHVAGTIAQSTNNRYGVAGVAYEAKIMPLKVLSAQGGGTTADIAEAIRFAANNGADVINMSLGGGGESRLMQEAIDYAHGKGVMIIAAAGNEGQNAASYPARYHHVMGVSAINMQNSKAPYSNYGAGVDIAAPGGDTAKGDDGGILQETIDRRTKSSIFKAFQGTSMAAPHVAGVAAAVKALGVKDPDQVWAILQKSAMSVSGDSNNYFGAGRLDAAAAVKLAQKGKGLWPFASSASNPSNSRIWYNWRAIPWKNIGVRWSAVLGLTWIISKAANHYRLNGNYWLGALLGSVGLFLLPPLYLFDLPHWPLNVLGSSLPELGSIGHMAQLSPITASALIPFGMLAALLSHPRLGWVTVGASVGVAAILAVSIFMQPALMWLGSGFWAQLFLAVNAALSLLIGYLGLKTLTQPT
jgi:serine protease